MSAAAGGDVRKPGTLAGDAVYCFLPDSLILELDTARHSLALIPVPPACSSVASFYWERQLVQTEGGGLGLAMATQARVLVVWKRDTGRAAAAAADLGWSKHRTIRLGRCLPRRRGAQGARPPSLLGFHEESNVLFLRIHAGLFAIQLESMQSRLVCQGVNGFEIFPFAGFYTADAAGAQTDDDAPELEDASSLSRRVMESLPMWHYADGDVQGPLRMSNLRGTRRLLPLQLHDVED